MYATPGEVRQATGDTITLDEPALGRLVGIASGIIQRSTRRAVYATTPLGLPEDNDLLDAMRDATIAQVRAWHEANILGEVTTGGATAPATVKASGSNGKSITLDTGTSDAAKSHLLTGGLSLEAELILDGVGLLTGLPGVYL